ncbi:chromatin associated protein KTI12 [Neolentinus lepideus HHB14362 ss-1]|uniref:Chromatin associated protein KTI12 n=1 Tax=Neolentinus lepideus HHB14362 ss-1 TaxID=1314782 RepID=A0A165PR57_9AGAM|nr:chromatin associated protein KTI12 [Neolentinus lepideus HHB14362 ss-1]
MALITFSGYPCSGKSCRAQQLKSHLEDFLQNPSYAGPKLKVQILSDDTLNIERSAYDSSRSEKPARGALFTAAQRQMGQDTILIVDSLNYIKGFRYQMYCAGRELKLRMCTVYVLTPAEMCKRWNEERTDGRKYAPETLDNLIMRYEEPSSMVRWDSPLFTVAWEDADVPAHDIWKAVTEGIVKPPNVGTQSVPKAPTDALRVLESIATQTVSAIMSAQSLAPSLGGPATLSLPSSSSSTLTVRINLPPRNVTLSELQRLKRQFVAVHKKAMVIGTTEKGQVEFGERDVAEKFVQYLEENFKP